MVSSIFVFSVEPGLPELTGVTRGVATTNKLCWGVGVFSEEFRDAACAVGSTNKNTSLRFRASDYDAIYGSSKTVTPLSYKTKFYIKA